ncbi:MAG: hypothetical protein AB4038_15310, partial [Prochloraceae cyanobacterium]
ESEKLRSFINYSLRDLSSNCTITSDYQGIVERLPMIIIAPSRFEVNVELPSFQRGQIQPGQKAFILLDRDRQPYVFVVNEDEGLVEQRWIQPGIERLAKREIIEGVEPGEKLVTEGKNRWVNGWRTSRNYSLTATRS